MPEETDPKALPAKSPLLPFHVPLAFPFDFPLLG